MALPKGTSFKDFYFAVTFSTDCSVEILNRTLLFDHLTAYMNDEHKLLCAEFLLQHRQLQFKIPVLPVNLAATETLEREVQGKAEAWVKYCKSDEVAASTFTALKNELSKFISPSYDRSDCIKLTAEGLPLTWALLDMALKWGAYNGYCLEPIADVSSDMKFMQTPLRATPIQENRTKEAMVISPRLGSFNSSITQSRLLKSTANSRMRASTQSPFLEPTARLRVNYFAPTQSRLFEPTAASLAQRVKSNGDHRQSDPISKEAVSRPSVSARSNRPEGVTAFGSAADEPIAFSRRQLRPTARQPVSVLGPSHSRQTATAISLTASSTASSMDRRNSVEVLPCSRALDDIQSLATSRLSCRPAVVDLPEIANSDASAHLSEADVVVASPSVHVTANNASSIQTTHVRRSSSHRSPAMTITATKRIALANQKRFSNNTACNPYVSESDKAFSYVQN